MPGKRDYDDIIRSVMASLSRGDTQDTGKEAVFDFPPGSVQLPKPTYPEIDPGYPGPFLRDPGELDPWEERYRT
jgi:hypothetical protein